MSFISVSIKNSRRPLLLDEVDSSILERAKWRLAHNRGKPSSVCGWIRGSGKNESIHRLILNCPPGLVVDHINGDVCDNRRENLRICTISQNSQNIRNRTLKKHKGVSFRKRYKSKPWVVSVSCGGKVVYVDFFETEIGAAYAHDIAVKAWHGEFAVCNFLSNGGN